jgi:hypothetical protein
MPSEESNIKHLISARHYGWAQVTQGATGAQTSRKQERTTAMFVEHFLCAKPTAST